MRTLPQAETEPLGLIVKAQGICFYSAGPQRGAKATLLPRHPSPIRALNAKPPSLRRPTIG